MQGKLTLRREQTNNMVLEEFTRIFMFRLGNLGDKIELVAFAKTLATYSGWSKKLSSLRCGYPHYEWWPEKG